MERHDRQLPMNTRTLGDIATRCQAFSKALHYREIEFHTHTSAQVDLTAVIEPYPYPYPCPYPYPTPTPTPTPTAAPKQGSPRLVEAMVSLHNSLQQPEAALGVLD